MLIRDLIEIRDFPAVVQAADVRSMRDTALQNSASNALNGASSLDASDSDAPALLDETTRDFLGGYLGFDERARHALEASLSSLGSSRGGAWFFNGVFGSGKSHLLGLLALLCDGLGHELVRSTHAPASTPLRSFAPRLVVHFSLDEYAASHHALEEIFWREVRTEWRRHHFEPRELPASFAAPQIAAPQNEPHRAADSAFDSAPPPKSPSDAAPSDAAAASVATASRSEVFAALEDALRARGLNGLVVFIDELSLFLSGREHRALQNDAAFLQFLGQRARRSSAASNAQANRASGRDMSTHAPCPLWIFAALQKTVEDIGDLDSYALSQIRDRFSTLPLSLAHLPSLIERRLVVRRDVGALHRFCEADYNALLAALPRLDFGREEWARLYPFHPATIALLEQVVARYGSRTRSAALFCAQSVRGDDEASQRVSPDALFSYIEPELAAHPDLRPLAIVWNQWRQGAEERAFEAEESARMDSLMRALLLWKIAGAAPSVMQLVNAVSLDALLPGDGNYEYGRILLEKMRLFAPLAVERREEAFADRYALDLGTRVGEMTRRFTANALHTLPPRDGRIARHARSCCREENLPLAGLQEAASSLVMWRNSARNIRIEVLDAPPDAATLANRLAALSGLGAPDDLALFIVPPFSSRSNSNVKVPRMSTHAADESEEKHANETPFDAEEESETNENEFADEDEDDFSGESEMEASHRKWREAMRAAWRAMQQVTTQNTVPQDLATTDLTTGETAKRDAAKSDAPSNDASQEAASQEAASHEVDFPNAIVARDVSPTGTLFDGATSANATSANATSVVSKAMSSGADTRWRGAVLWWLPREASPDEWQQARETTAQQLLKSDPQLADNRRGRAVLEHLRQGEAGREAALGRIAARLLLEGQIATGAGTSVDAADLAMRDSWPATLEALAEFALPSIFPRFSSVAPRLRVLTGANSDALCLDILRRPAATPFFAVSLARVVRAVGEPLGVARETGGRWKIAAPRDDLMQEITERVGNGALLSSIEAALAKSEWGLPPDESRIAICALLRSGELAAFDARGVMLSPSSIGLPLRREVHSLRPGRLLDEASWRRLNDLFTLLLTGETLGSPSFAEQERAVARISSWREDALAQTELAQARLHQWRGSSASPSRRPRIEAAWDIITSLLHVLKEDGGSVLERAARFDLAALPDAIQTWRETLRKLEARHAVSLEAHAFLSHPDLVAPTAMQAAQTALLARFEAGEEVLDDETLPQDAAHWIHEYSIAYGEWHQSQNAAPRFAPYRRLLASNELRALQRLETLASRGFAQGAHARACISEALNRECTRDGELRGEPVCVACRLRLNARLVLRDPMKIEASIEAGIASFRAALREVPAHEYLKRFPHCAPLLEWSEDEQADGTLLPLLSDSVLQSLDEGFRPRRRVSRSWTALRESTASCRTKSEWRRAFAHWLDGDDAPGEEDEIVLED